MENKPNILVVCGKNKRRSRTAEFIFKHDPRINIRSAGLSPKSDNKISENDLNWADVVLVMEPEHQSKIRDIYTHLQLPRIEVLHIEDDFEFMDEELIDTLLDRMNSIFKNNFNV